MGIWNLFYLSSAIVSHSVEVIPAEFCSKTVDNGPSRRGGTDLTLCRPQTALDIFGEPTVGSKVLNNKIPLVSNLRGTQGSRQKSE